MIVLGLFSSSSSNSKEASSPAQESPSTGDADAVSIISEGASIEGTLDLSSVNLCVEGTIHGDISTDGRVVVAEGAEVEGTINAETVRIAGYVDGHVRAEGKLVLCPSSEVHATLEADVLEIQPGADFGGEVPDKAKSSSEEAASDASVEESASGERSEDPLSEAAPAEHPQPANGNVEHR